jgi:hypothetical protein
MVALSRTSGSVLAMPKLLGPITRSPAACAVSIRVRCRAAPSGPASANPAEPITTPPAPADAASARASATFSAGTLITARSMGVPASDAVRYAVSPATRSAAGCTGTIAPVNPPSRRLPSIAAPIPCPLALAP